MILWLSALWLGCAWVLYEGLPKEIDRADAWLYWAAFQYVQFPLMLLGPVILAPFCLARAWVERQSRLPQFAGRRVRAWRFALLDAAYGNDEDGVTGPAWYLAGRDDRWRAFMWSAIRNTVYGLRTAPGALRALDADAVTRRRGPFVVCSAGPFQCLHVLLGSRHKIVIGWRVWPDNRAGDRAWPVISWK